MPAVMGEKSANRRVERLSPQEYEPVKAITALGGVYFNVKIASRLWKDNDRPLERPDRPLGFAGRTCLPVLL